MDRKGHRWWGWGSAIAFWLFTFLMPQVSFTWNVGNVLGTMALVVCAYMLPDWDQQTDKLDHRNWFTHSGFVPFILMGIYFISSLWFIEWRYVGVGFFSLVVGVHLLCDLWKKPKTIEIRNPDGSFSKKQTDPWRGFALISIKKGDRMPSMESKMWLTINGLFCIGLAILWCWI